MFNLRILLLISCVSVRALGQPALEGVMGTWATTGFGSKVQIYPCENGRNPVELCGSITWLWEELDEQGIARVDGNNPDKTLRGRALVGTQILSGFRQNEDGVWKGGKVYNPDDGRTYSGTIQDTPTGLLKLKGCALKFFCQTQQWRRTADVCIESPVAIK